MKEYSYIRLLLATTAGLTCLFALFAWREEVEPATFLTQRTLRTTMVVSLILALCLLLSLKKWGNAQRELKIVDHIKLYPGALIVAVLFTYVPVSTVTWLLPGTLSTYTAASEFSSPGRHSCSGVRVFDPDLKKSIKVCQPVGNYHIPGTVRVTKLTNALGVVIVYATVNA